MNTPTKHTRASAGQNRANCIYCGRSIIQERDGWVDPEATGDDKIWRETCDSHDTFTAEHEPQPAQAQHSPRNTLQAQRDSYKEEAWQNQQMTARRDREIYFVMNRHSNTAAIFKVSCFEELQGMFRVGIVMPDGQTANGIGRCRNAAQFAIKAARAGTSIQYYGV